MITDIINTSAKKIIEWFKCVYLGSLNLDLVDKKYFRSNKIGDFFFDDFPLRLVLLFLFLILISFIQTDSLDTNLKYISISLIIIFYLQITTDRTFKIKWLENEQDNLKAEFHKYVLMNSYNIDIREIPIHRLIIIRVYFQTTKERKLVIKIINDIFNILYLEISDEFPFQDGSIFKEVIGKTTELLTQPQVDERLKKLERSLEVYALHQPQAEIDKNKAEAVSQLITSLSNVSSVEMQIGSLILIKLTDEHGASHIQVKQLTQKELMFLEKHPIILKNPQEFFNHLQLFSKDENYDPTLKIPIPPLELPKPNNTEN